MLDALPFYFSSVKPGTSKSKTLVNYFTQSRLSNFAITSLPFSGDTLQNLIIDFKRGQNLGFTMSISMSLPSDSALIIIVCVYLRCPLSID
ncbi:hypothetical protein L1987_59537 [Smallanthus sonchifolius]|uniref:Uncharacterized protein n=1 Tax=Smallanthus sonchifolius TaxID=185202 RepID=A0ACB9D5K1_9ASTR|nr:hypothetical protein L1987_59537 [Smallanthus sonchifolius]